MVHVSSVAVLPPSEYAIEGWLPPPEAVVLDGLGGYAASKVLAEEAVRRGWEAGVDVVVARLSALGPPAAAGSQSLSDGLTWNDASTWNEKDVLTHLVRLCEEMGVGPRGGMGMGWFPVDVAAKILVKVALAGGGLGGWDGPRVFHLAGEGPKLYEVLDQLGVERRMESEEWKEEAAKVVGDAEHWAFAVGRILMGMSFCGVGGVRVGKGVEVSELVGVEWPV